jgi:hypothetical protein
MHDTYAINALRRKRATLLGDIIIARETVDKLLEDLACLDATILLFDSGADPSTIKPVVRRPRDAPFRYGELGRLIRKVLREAGTPLNVREIARRIAAEKGMDGSHKALSRLCKRIQSSLWRSNAGLVGDVNAEGFRWSEGVLWRVDAG